MDQQGTSVSRNPPSGRLAGRTIVVTGAGRGIGAAVARAFAAEGALVFCAARTAAQIEGIAGEIVAAGGRARAVPVDIADPASIEAMYRTIEAEAGRLDGLMANAGISGQREASDSAALDMAQWREVIDINLIGAYDSIRLALPLMKRSGGGHIIVTGSGAGHAPIANLSSYCAAKAGLWMLVRTLAEEVRGDGISINELIPGPVLTDLVKEEKFQQAGPRPWIQQEWMKQPEDVVPLAMFLASQPEGAGPTGQSFKLNRRSL